MHGRPEMMLAAMLVAVFLPMFLGAAFLLARQMRRRRAEEMSAVSRQHIELFQGEPLSETAVHAAVSRFRDLLERGQPALVEAALRPGTQYVYHVHALAEIGTEDARRILERQLQRRLSDDPLEQAWYRIDVAHGLRMLNRAESLPHLLRCAEEAGEAPLGHFFAAESVCFLGFAGYVRQLEKPLGRAALRLLHRALEGLRFGVPAQLISEARLGETIESMWDHRPDEPHPLMVRVLAEGVRLVHRAPHLRAALADDRAEQEAFDWQLSRLALLEPAFVDYLRESAGSLRSRLPRSRSQDVKDALHALVDLRAEAGAEAVALLSRPGFAYAELAMELLTWSRDAGAGAWLRGWIRRHVPLGRRQRRPRRLLAAAAGLPPDVPYAPALRALRGHPAAETEALLLLAARDHDPAYRAASLSSLGWWEPVYREQVVDCLNQARKDAHPEVRRAARAALARLGERQALQWFRAGLTSENPHRVQEMVQAIAAEGLTLLWPDLDRLADAEDIEVAHHAREALARLCEEMESGRT